MALQDKVSAATTQTSVATENLQKDAGAHTDAAAREGQHDTEAAKVQAASYLDQAKSLAGAVLGTAQVSTRDRLYSPPC